MKKTYTQPSIELNSIRTDILMESLSEDNYGGTGDLFPLE